MEPNAIARAREEFEKRLDELFKLCNGKWVVLWGYSLSGRFLEYQFRRHGKQVDICMDTDEKMHGVSRPEILKSLDPNTHVVILTFSPDVGVLNTLERYGFRRGESYIPAKTFFYGSEEEQCFLSYHEWIEHEYPVDIWRGDMELNAQYQDFNYYSKTPGFSLMTLLDTFSFDEDDRIFDYGCGKGSALALFEWAGVSWGGIEFDLGLYETCLHNMQVLGLSTDTIHQGDAAAFSDIDAYNYFYMYNPFVGETFKKVIQQMEWSQKRRPRVLTLIYCNPICHESVVEHGVFQLLKAVQVNAFGNDANIYRTHG